MAAFPEGCAVSMTDEIFDVCDANDRVIGRAPRADVHARGLLHRAVSIFVFNTRGELLLQRRSAAKDEFPLLYTSSASGHVTAGETYDECAPRELREELGIEAAVEFIARFPASSDTANEHTALYRTVTDEPVTPDPEEIEGVEFRCLDEVAEMIQRRPHDFTPPFRLLFGWYREHAAQ